MNAYRMVLLTLLTVGFAATPLAAVAADESQSPLVPDPVLEELILSLKNKYEHKGDEITQEDLQNIYFLDAKDLGIRDLTGLEHCSNLGEAKLSGNEITDVSPLAQCDNLQSLDLSNNKIVDVAPLGGIEKLQYLNIENNRVESLDGLQSLEALNSLYAAGNKIASMEPVQELEKLWSLDLSGNRIEDMSPASSLPRLSFLSLRDNELEKVVSLPGTTGMLLTDFRDNEISDLSPLVSMAEADRRDGVRFTPFWRLFLEGNPLDATTKMAVETLEKLGVRLDLTEKEAEPKTIGAAEEAGENQPGSDEQNNSDEQKDSTNESKK